MRSPYLLKFAYRLSVRLCLERGELDSLRKAYEKRYGHTYTSCVR